MDHIEIPSSKLNPETLTRLIEEFICREGTDYGHHDYSLPEKVAQVRKQIDSGHTVIAFDPNTNSCTLASKDQLS